MVDRSQDLNSADEEFNDPDVLGFASVIFGIAGQLASIANAPFDDDGPGSQDPENPRQVANGTAYMKFAVDYNGQPAGNFSTSTLELDLVTLS